MKKEYIDPLDEALRLLVLENADELEFNQTVKGMVFMEENIEVEMSAVGKEKLISSLTSLLTSPSFGDIIKAQMEKVQLDATRLSQETQLPETLIEELTMDRFYVNNVPIKFFKRLLNTLQITFESAESAVRKTFTMLQSQQNDYAASVLLRPSFRKSLMVSSDEVTDMMTSNKGKELFENKEALDKYLQRLNELMQD